MRNGAGASETKERAPLAVVRAPERPARDDLECFLIGWQIRKAEWFGGAGANASFRELRTGFSFSDPLLEACQRRIDAAVDDGQPVTPQHIAAKIALDCGEADESQIFNFLRSHSLGAPAAGSEADLRRQMASTLNLLREAGRADRRRQAHEMLLASGIDVLDDVRALLEEQPIANDLLSSSAFIAGFQAVDYLWDGILQRGFLYSMTGQTARARLRSRCASWLTWLRERRSAPGMPSRVES
jgi:hypothetical protein